MVGPPCSTAALSFVFSLPFNDQANLKRLNPNTSCFKCPCVLKKLLTFLLHVVKRPKNQFPFLESRLLEEVQSEWNCRYLAAKCAL